MGFDEEVVHLDVVGGGLSDAFVGDFRVENDSRSKEGGAINIDPLLFLLVSKLLNIFVELLDMGSLFVGAAGG